ncbi:uncharacterized protein FIBRA_05173 [Fibroporia radiculosa]|uniref:Major facilitator superfamily (MFS) profile domain-containing protein n=1 Tax=Fibroporia radiculosa TaxID=599839 RepID=J4H3C9_9APHY|nr:uncharacterized protein FIBRA_05173 [Fibroporia radiculosa]CCM03054.1 predicted protein [Fibroporia radiculosa]
MAAILIYKYFFKKDKDAVAPTGSTPSTSDNQAQTSNRRWMILLSISLLIPVLFETLDYTVVATAQTHIASSFNQLNLQSWIGTAYLLTSTVFLPLFASVADIWGRHSALQLSLFFFMIGSAISTGSNNMVTMLVGRGVAGVGAAGLQAVVRIIMADSRSLDANNWQQSMLFLLFAIGYCIGPFIGGELLTISYRWIFAINLPACVVGMVFAFFILRRRAKGPQRRSGLPASMDETFVQQLLRVDWIGAFLFMAGGILIMLALNWGSTYGWDSARVVVCFVIGGLIYVAFVLVEWFLERRAMSAASSQTTTLLPEPMLPLVVFRSLDICLIQASTFVSGMVMIVIFYFVATFMTIVAGRSASSAGSQLVYFAPGMGAGSITQIYWIKRFRQPKAPIVLGGVVMTVALGLLSMALEQNKEGLVDGFMAMTGVGVGLSIGALAVHARFSQPADKVAIVSALSLFFRALGGTIGLAQCGAVLNAKVKLYLEDLITSGTISGAAAGQLSQASASLSSIQSINALPSELQSYVKDAFRDGTRWAFISLVPWAALAAIGTLFLSKIRDTDREPEVQEEIYMEVKQDSAETRVLHSQRAFVLGNPAEEEVTGRGGLMLEESGWEYRPPVPT